MSKRLLETEASSPKRQRMLPWEVASLIMPYIPQARQICRQWRNEMEPQFCTKVKEHAFKLLCRGMQTNFTDMPALYRGMGLMLQLKERGIEPSIISTLQRAWTSLGTIDEYPLEHFKKTFPFLYDIVPKFVDEKRPTIWSFMQETEMFSRGARVNYGELIMYAISFCIPETLWLDALKRALKFNLRDTGGCPNLVSNIPHFLACAGISLKKINAFEICAEKQIWDRGVVFWKNLYPDYIRRLERKFPGFIEHIIQTRPPLDCDWGLIVWLFTQNLTLTSQIHLLRFIARCIDVSVPSLIHKYYGKSLEHISVSTAAVLKVLSETRSEMLVGIRKYCVRFILSREPDCTSRINLLNVLVDYFASPLYHKLTDTVLKSTTEQVLFKFLVCRCKGGWRYLTKAYIWLGDPMIVKVNWPLVATFATEEIPKQSRGALKKVLNLCFPKTLK